MWLGVMQLAGSAAMQLLIPLSVGSVGRCSSHIAFTSLTPPMPPRCLQHEYCTTPPLGEGLRRLLFYLVSLSLAVLP